MEPKFLQLSETPCFVKCLLLNLFLSDMTLIIFVASLEIRMYKSTLLIARQSEHKKYHSNDYISIFILLIFI